MSTADLVTSTSTSRYFIENLRDMNPASIWAPFFINPAIALMDSYRLKPFPCTVACENIVSALLSKKNVKSQSN
jgi:hypothetical protein